MKKNYEFVEINVISLDDADVITASWATEGLSGLLEGHFGLGSGLNTQDF